LFRIPRVIQEVKFVTLRGLTEFIRIGHIIKICNVAVLYVPTEPVNILTKAARL